MNLTELQAEVATITNRGDLTAEILTAVRSATLKMHRADYFFRDLFETGIAFDDPLLYIQEVEVLDIIPRWRSLKYLRKFDATGTPAPGVPGLFFDIITPDEVFDSYKIQRENCCYMAGDVLKIRSDTQLANALLGCYLNPDITTLTYTSWIARDFPYAIVWEAAAQVFKMVGKDSEAQNASAMAMQELAEIRMSNIVINGE